MKINERIKKIREYFCNDDNLKFAEIMEENPNTTSNWIGGGREVGKSVITKILSKFSIINPAWLLTGNGECYLKDEIIKRIMFKDVIIVEARGVVVTYANIFGLVVAF